MAKDMMKTDLGDIHVPGWDEMLENHRTRALTLQAMVNLEIRHYMNGDPLPTQKVILQEVIDLGGGLSSKSEKTINVHIRNLIKEQHVVTRTDYTSPSRGRGGPASPWMTRYVSPRIQEILKKQSKK